MQKFSLQTIIVFSLGLICGFCIEFSFLCLVALFIALSSVFIYTIRDAQGLKHNQDLYLIFISSTLYLLALLISIYGIVALILFTLYEFSKKRTLKAIVLRLLPIYIITLIVVLKTI
jgi:hypothetical protein